MDRDNIQIRSAESKFKTREEGGNLYLDGYFSVFNENYEIAPGLTESIAPGAFTDTIGDDIRALVNHDTRLVLGRTTAGTLELREDDRGLWGSARINPNDSDAMNLYERVKRGDVSQCSFGFDIERETTDVFENGDIHWTIEKVRLYEVSVVTFPAYEGTGVSARMRQAQEMREKENEAWRIKTKARLKGEKNGSKNNDAPSENR